MADKFVELESISEVHRLYGYSKPKHPLITVIDLMEMDNNRQEEEVLFRMGFYTIFCKKFTGVLKYGKSHYDFDEGSLMFTAPHQVMAPSSDVRIQEGWGLFFHPDLLNGSRLGSEIHQYTFFQYDANEALHVSDEEKKIIKDCIEKIEREYSQNIDQHTQGLILSNLELLLNYCSRFYNRQFLTRAKVNNDVVQQFEKLLKEYFAGTLVETGLPDVQYFASRLHLSPNYLADLLKKYTGKTTQEHIHLELIDKARSLLWSTEKPVSEIAYELGFEHPSHFTKIFKAKTGKSPKEYRHSN